MARISDNNFEGTSASNEANTQKFDALEQTNIEVPHSGFIADADISRDGQDLVLQAPDGESLIVSNYFTATPAPMIESADGSVLTPNLINSFLTSSSEYANAGSLSDESPVGAVEEATGEATVIRTDGTSEPITLGTPIYEGDIIETAANGAVNILFLDETSMAVSENARLAVDDYSYDPATESGETNLSVLRGVFVYTSGLIGRDDPDDVMIDTPVGSIGIRGTIIAGKIAPDEQSEITVVEGAIVIKNATGEVTLSQQYQSIKLGGFNSEIQDMGIKSAEDVSKTYGSVSDVLPKLFSSINDNIQAEKNSAQQAADDKAASEEVIEEIQLEEENLNDDAVKAKNPVTEEIMLDTMPENMRPATEIIIEDNKQEIKNKVEKFSLDTDNNINNVRKFFLSENGDSIFRGKEGNLKGLAISLSENPLFENSQEGDLLARVVIQNAPTGSSFLLAGANSGYFDLTQSVAANGAIILEVALSLDGASNLPNIGAKWDPTDLQGWNSGNKIYSLHLEPITQDASVNINLAGGLDYQVDTLSGLGILDTAEKLDFNGDGKLDALSANKATNSNKGKVTIEVDGGNTHISGHVTGQELGEHVSSIGDINGDGLSDILIANENPISGNHDAYVVFGNDTPQNLVTHNNASNGSGIKISTSHEMLAGGHIGDINGDGFDDFAVSLKMGGAVNTYAIYGKDTITDLNITDLENPDIALKIQHAGINNATDYSVHGVGDQDGDGFDDFQVGTISGDKFVVYGQAGDDVVTDESTQDGANPNAGVIQATANNQSLAGDVNFHDNTKDNLRMKGGSSNNIFEVTDNNFAKIDGGLGQDTIKFDNSNSLDFSNFNFEDIQGIEKIEFGQSTGTVILTTENIFNLLEASDNGKLFINGTNSAQNLQFGSSSSLVNLEDALESITGLDNVDTHGSVTIDGETYTHYQVGDNSLYIDTDISTNLT